MKYTMWLWNVNEHEWRDPPLGDQSGSHPLYKMQHVLAVRNMFGK